MSRPIIKQRTPYFLGCEGESERSFFKWILDLASNEGLKIHFNSEVLGGRSYPYMLTILKEKLGRQKTVKFSGKYLIIDADRADLGNDWTIEELRLEAAKNNIILIVQKPKLEALILKVFKGNENKSFKASDCLSLLKQKWPNYRKGIPASEYARKFTLEDLIRASNFEPDLDLFLKKIGLKNK